MVWGCAWHKRQKGNAQASNAELGLGDVAVADVVEYHKQLVEAGAVDHELDSSELDLVSGGSGHQSTIVSDAAFIVA